MFILFLLFVLVVGLLIVKNIIEENKRKEVERQYNLFKTQILNELGLSTLYIFPYFDASITVKSRQALDNYDDIKFLKEDSEMLNKIEKNIQEKNTIANILKNFSKDNKYMDSPFYSRIRSEIDSTLNKIDSFKIKVNYITSSGNNLGFKEIFITQRDINRYKKNPALLMTKGEYNKFLKETEKKELSQKQKKYYDILNNIIDYSNTNKDSLITKKDCEDVDNLIGRLFDRTVNSIKKIKTLESEEWDFIENFMFGIENDIKKIVTKNLQILEYYNSSDFLKIKKTCESLMNSQKEFNEYINEKVQLISQLFGTRVVRNETDTDDKYNYIRPYKKTITPFTAEISSTVFASAENNSLEYIIKYFYSNKKLYREQIQNLYKLIEELETLREAKQIIENYKKEYQQYINDVPDFIMENDNDGFYSRLGFAIIDESTLVVNYKFSYTSNGGMVQRSFTVPMTEETIIELIQALESKLTIGAFIKEQRILMTKKLRELIKTRDNFTCCSCSNSTQLEPNLLLEIDHIIPVSKGGETVENNLQTLCWKCNRSKSNKVITLLTT